MYNHLMLSDLLYLQSVKYTYAALYLGLSLKSAINASMHYKKRGDIKAVNPQRQKIWVQNMNNELHSSQNVE